LREELERIKDEEEERKRLEEEEARINGEGQVNDSVVVPKVIEEVDPFLYNGDTYIRLDCTFGRNRAGELIYDTIDLIEY